MISHNDAYELLEAYAFGTIDKEEAIELEKHLESDCEKCNIRLKELSELSVALASNIKQLQPSGQVREKIMSRIKKLQHDSKRRNIFQRNRTGWAVSAVALVALVTLYFVNWNLKKEYDILMNDYSTSQIEITQLKEDLLAYEDATMLLGEPGMQFIDMTGVDPNPQAFGKVVIDPQKNAAVVYMYSLPQTPEGMEYQLWVLREGKPTSVGTFTVAEDGSAVLKIKAIPNPATIASFEVTIEPFGGELEPTGMMYLTGPNVYQFTE